MAPVPTFSGLVAATWMALCPSVLVPPAPVVEAVTARAINATARTLATRRRVRLGRPITVRVLDRPHMLAARDSLLEAPSSPEAAHEQAALYALLGLGPAPGLVGAPRGPAAADASGLYDAARGQLLIGSWCDLRADRFALGRDVALTVLDRRFDLRRWLALAHTPSARQTRSDGKPETKFDANTDALLARQALLEGDAAVQSLELEEPQGVLPPPRALAAIVADARATIAGEASGISSFDLGQRLFVELDGLSFVAEMRNRAPWSAIDWVWAHPPQSTEQVLHPDKFRKSEKPDGVASRLPARVRGHWQVTARDTLGELGLRIFLGRGTNDYRAARGASGWGGDRAVLFRGSDAPGGGSDARPAGSTPPSATKSVVVSDSGAQPTFAAWIITFDDETDAEDFAGQAGRVLAVLAHAAATEDRAAPGHLRVITAAGRLYVLDRRQRTVGMVFAAPAEGEAILSELMSAATPRPRRGVGPSLKSATEGGGRAGRHRDQARIRSR